MTLPPGRIFYASTMRSIQSPQRMLTARVARTDWPHLGQISFRVLLGLCPPGSVSAPVWAAPPAPVRMMGGRLARPIWISFHPLESAYSTRLSPGVVFQPYCPQGTQVRPRRSASALKRRLWYLPPRLTSLMPCLRQYRCTISWSMVSRGSSIG